MLRTVLTILQVLSAFAIVGLVLLQRGKGADAGAGFGAGASGTVFGARGATTGLSRMTAIFAAIFILAGMPCVFVWLGFGAMMQRLLRSDGALRAFNISMGVLLAASAVVMF